MKPVDDKHLETDATRAPADTTAVHDEDPRLLEAVQEYMTAVEAGRRPSQQELRAKYPEIADELSQCIQGLAEYQRGSIKKKKNRMSNKQKN